VAAQLRELSAELTAAARPAEAAQASQAAVDVLDAFIPPDHADTPGPAPAGGLSGSLGDIVRLSGLSDKAAITVGAVDRLRSDALASYGVTMAPLAGVVGMLSDNDGTLLRVDVNAVAEQVTPIEALVQLPPVAPFDLTAAGRAVAALEPTAAYERMLTYAHQNVSDLVARRPGGAVPPGDGSAALPGATGGAAARS